MNKKIFGALFSVLLGITGAVGVVSTGCGKNQAQQVYQEIVQQPQQTPDIPQDSNQNAPDKVAAPEDKTENNQTFQNNNINTNGMKAANFTRYCSIEKQSYGIRIAPTGKLNDDVVKIGSRIILKVLLQTSSVTAVKLNDNVLTENADYIITNRNGICIVEINYLVSKNTQNTGNFCFVDIVGSVPTKMEVTAFWIYSLDEQYLALDYIENTGTQFIDTGFKPTINTKLELSFMCTSTSTTAGFMQITGTCDYYRASTSWQVAFYVANDNIVLDLGTNGAGSKAVDRNSITEVVMDKNGGYVNGQYLGNPTGTLSNAENYNLWIFDCNNGGGHTNYFVGRIYGYKIYDNNVLVRNFIPMLRKTDGAVGLYDLANNVFYASAADGNFACEYTFDASAYSFVNYIESTGTQYIDTGFKPTENSKIELSFAASINSANSGWTQVTGSRDYWQAPNAWQVAYNVDSDLLQIELGTSAAGQISVKKDTIIDIAVDKNGSYMNGKHFAKQGTLSGTGNYNLWIFDDHSAGGHENPFTGRLYSYKIYDNDILVRYFLPAVRKADGAVGLVDVVNNVFYPNAGSGEFSCGRLDLNNKTYTIMDYIQSTGTQYIDLGWATTTGMICQYVASWPEGECGWIVGSHDDWPDYRRNGAWWDKNSGWILGYGDHCPGNNSIAVEADKPYNVKFSTVIGQAYLDVNGTRLHTITDSNQNTAVSNVLVFTNNIDLLHSTPPTKAKIYSLKIWDSNGNLKFNLVPAVRNADGAVGLVDVVSNTFYGNAGSGVFQVG